MDSPPSAAQTKPGLYHANHLIIKITLQTTPLATACHPPKNPGICQALFFAFKLMR
jgi:hypothetical protein